MYVGDFIKRKNATKTSTINAVFLTSVSEDFFMILKKLFILSVEKGSFLIVGHASWRLMPLTTSITTGSLTGEARPCKLCAHDRALRYWLILAKEPAFSARCVR